MNIQSNVPTLKAGQVWKTRNGAIVALSRWTAAKSKSCPEEAFWFIGKPGNYVYSNPTGESGEKEGSGLFVFSGQEHGLDLMELVQDV